MTDASLTGTFMAGVIDYSSDFEMVSVEDQVTLEFLGIEDSVVTGQLESIDYEDYWAEFSFPAPIEISIGDLAHLIANLMDTEITIHSSEKRIRPGKSEVERLICNNSKLQKHTAWKPENTLEQGLAEVIGWIKKPENLSMYKTEQYNV